MDIRSIIKNVSCLVLILILSFIFLTNTVSAETKTFIKEYTYQASEYDSKATARILALEQVKRLLLEELGTYLESETEVKNFQLSQDRIVAYTAGIVKSEIINEKWDGKSYYLTAKMQADPQEIYKILNEMLSDRKKRNELEKAKIQTEELLREVEILKKELAGTESKKVSVVMQNQKKYQILVNSISAIDWYNVGKAYSSRYSFRIKYDPQYAIVAFNRAIEINPRLAEAYYERGNMYLRTSDYSYPLTFDNKTKAIEDFNMAIHLDPKLSEAWLALAGIYSSLRDFDQALNYCEKAIEANANDEYLYANRAWLNIRLKKNFQQAIKDFTKAIELETDKSSTSNGTFILPPYLHVKYFGRGNAHKKIGDYQSALKDYNKGIDILINAPDPYAFEISAHYDELLNRALINVESGNFQQAIRDYDQIIKSYDEKKKKALAKGDSYVPEVPAKLYYYRGRLYDKLGNMELASKDYDRSFQLSSGDLVFFEAEELLKEEKYIESLQAINRWIELALPRLSNESQAKGIKLVGHFFRSFVYKQLKNYQLALSEVDSAYQQAPNMDLKKAVLCRKAMIFWDIGKADDSIKYIDEAIKIGPDDPLLFKVRGIYHLLMKKYSLALADFENVIKIDSQKASYLDRTLGDLKTFLPYEKNDWKSEFPMAQEREIYNNFQILAEKYPKFKTMYDKYLTDHWEKRNLRLLGKSSQMKKVENEWMRIGNVMFANENYDGAVKAFTKAVEQEPKNANMYVLRGDAYFKFEKYQDAQKDYGKAISLQPNEMSFYIKHAEASYYLKDYKKIVTYLDVIEKKHPCAQVLLCRGWAFELLGKYDQAFIDYNKSFKIGKSAEALLSRGSIHIELRDYNQAIQDINQAIAFYLESRAKNPMAFSYVENLKADKSSEFCITLERSSLYPGFNEYDAYNKRGIAYENLGNYRRAIEDYDVAIRLKPDYAWLYVIRANTYHKLSQYQRAIEDYNAAIRLKPDDAIAYNNRALAYLLLDNNNLGCRDAQKACALGVCKALEAAKSNGSCR